MQRRKFLQNIGLSSLAIPLSSYATTSFYRNYESKDIIKPKALKVGDTIGIVSPASAIFETEPYQIAKESFEAMGLKVKFGEFVKNRYGHLAGTDKERAGELNAMFKDKSIDAIIALRGGSGSARILELLDYQAIKENPKIFIGYSDITALHLAIFEKTGLVTFHAPVAVSTWNTFSVSHLKAILFNKESPLLENPKSLGDNLTQIANRTRTITPGTGKGRLLGGNLSVLTGIMGSKYFPDDWNNKILYIEDVGEKVYAVDRMMTQLQLGGVFKQITGFIFGKCTECDPGGSGYGSLTLEEVLDHYIKPLGIPAFSGAMIGHIDDNSTIPNGIEAKIDASAGTIQLLEAAVI
ncbi:S66 peptidase family protein [Zunongwangia profunda]|uniref:Muramoyltetrapeptide carboxypeptidase n=2 Tax=Zunongwangia profunda TaxID=398743 RepID=D5BLI0_ZUNPS|nr:LD-carboxypeptidase [Zunongwangia profunda]ADF54106.1 muramoyltetrapeptide carboxypeptidase [Zunongwangia profunda SM-A87]HAJ82788.1 LD-carboxypeptidase [Zunongwangia profunda]HCV82577.1 LD-carboxypeptidase [Zunongwangia profunda]|tara:strand:- start:1278 stop:2333 length:1056 start_codon:yes stop_codon:yes gene_type:complete